MLIVAPLVELVEDHQPSRVYQVERGIVEVGLMVELYVALRELVRSLRVVVERVTIVAIA